MTYYHEWLASVYVVAVFVGIYGFYISYKFNKKYPHLSRKALMEQDARDREQ